MFIIYKAQKVLRSLILSVWTDAFLITEEDNTFSPELKD